MEITGKIKYDTKIHKEKIKNGMTIERIQVLNFFLNRDLILDLAELLNQNLNIDQVMINIPSNSNLFLEPQKSKSPQRPKTNGKTEGNVINFEKYLK